MSYLIDAWLEDGIPQVRVRDAQTGDVRLRWRRAVPGAADGGRDGHADPALQGLFKGLVLLSCASKLALIERTETAGFGEECLDCGGCAAGTGGYATKGSAQTNQTDKVVYLRDRGAGRVRNEFEFRSPHRSAEGRARADHRTCR